MAELLEPFGFEDEFTTEHANRMLDFYCKTLTSLGYESVPFDDIEVRIGSTRFETPKFQTLNYALWMCNQTRDFLRQGRIVKAYRWIGFIQGILFTNGVFSIAELKNHNRFDLPPVPPRGR
jgi:hypothetical protein